MKLNLRIVVFFSFFIILSSFRPTNASSQTTAAGVLPKVGLSQAAIGQTLRVYYDKNSDLWVESPFYTWNITSGKNITARGGASPYEWGTNPQAGSARVADALFLVARGNGPVTSRIFYALPDEAVVYLERKVTGGAEGVELSFRASDGLIRFSHRWQGPNPPSAVQVSQSPVASAARVDKRNGTFPPSGRAPGRGLNYSVDIDPAAREGHALLSPLANHPAPSTSPCFTRYPSREPALHDPCKFPNFFLPGQVLGTQYLFFFETGATASMQKVETMAAALTLDLPDLNAASMARLPRYDYGAAKEKPAAGDTVTFQARVANRGGQATGAFQYEWYIDQVVVETGTYPGLTPGEMILLSRNWTWQVGAHTVRLELDSGNLITEVSEQNNSVEDRTDGLAVGFWVEQSVYDYFNLHQVDLGLGSVSWDDWAQRQIRVWNDIMLNAVHPLTPQGVLDRVRLDKVTLVPDGTLPHPYPGNYPDTSDKTVDMMWGFDAELVGPGGFYITNPSVQNVEPSLLHEMSHARYLSDLYGLDVGFPRVYLASAATASDTTMTVDVNVETRSDFGSPSYLAIEGELVICQSKSGAAFTNCTRSAEGTTPRAHAANAVVNRADIRLQDGQGSLVMARPAMPLVGNWDDHVYYNRHPNDMMSGGMVYEDHSAYAWNRIAGRRPICGNYNAPCNISEYLNDIPAQNVLEVRDVTSQPIYGARVDLFQAKPNDGWYGKLWLNTPDATYYTDAQGRVAIGHFPFGTGSTIIHTYGRSNTILLLKISSGANVSYQFFEVTQANEAYWAGQQGTAVYPVGTNFPHQCPTISEWKGEYWNNETLNGDPTLCRNDTAVNFDWGTGSPAPSIQADAFSARWTRVLSFQGHTYQFDVEHDDGARLYIDGALAYENWCSGCTISTVFTHTLTSGTHLLQYEMHEHASSAKAKLNWAVACYSLTTNVNPSGSGNVTASPPPNCNGTEYMVGTTVSLTATANTGYQFINWSGDASGSTNSTTVALNGDKSVTANFTQQCFTLTKGVSPTGSGTVSANPSPNCNNGTQYSWGTNVTLTATANTGYQFNSWSGDASGSANPTTVTVNGNKAATANFLQLLPDLRPYAPTGYPYPVVPSSMTGTHTVNTLYAQQPTYFDWHFTNSGTATALGNFYVELWIDDVKYIRYPFSNWGAGWTSGFDDWAITVPAPGWHTVKLITDPDNTIAESDETNNTWQMQFNWVPVCYTLTATASPTAGATFSSNPSPNCNNGTQYTSGTNVQLTANPNGGFSFNNWSGDASGSANPTTFAMNGDKSVTANLRYLTATALSSSVNPSVFGQSIIITSTTSTVVSGVTPTGSVTLWEGTTTLGSGALSGGTITFTSSSLAPGNHSLITTYPGQGNYLPSSSPVITQTVNKASTTTAITSSTNPSVVGQSVTITATVTAEAPGGGTPTGSVTFKDGATTLGTGTLSGGLAALTSSALTLGSHSLTAVFGEDTNYKASTSSTLTQTVNKASTTVTLAPSTNPSVFGQSVTFTATLTVVTPGSGTPTGTVTFKEGSTTLGSSSLSSGQAVFPTSGLSVGSHSVTATYIADSNFNASTSGAVNLTVGKSSTSTTITSSANPASKGQSITLTAHVTPVSPGGGITGSGSVDFMEGTTKLGTGNLSGGHATLTLPSLLVGNHSITAIYGGDGSYNGSTSTAFTQTVNDRTWLFLPYISNP